MSAERSGSGSSFCTHVADPTARLSFSSKGSRFSKAWCGALVKEEVRVSEKRGSPETWRQREAVLREERRQEAPRPSLDLTWPANVHSCPLIHPSQPTADCPQRAKRERTGQANGPPLFTLQRSVAATQGSPLSAPPCSSPAELTAAAGPVITLATTAPGTMISFAVFTEDRCLCPSGSQRRLFPSLCPNPPWREQPEVFP